MTEKVRCTHCGTRFKATYLRCPKCCFAEPGNIGAQQEDERIVRKLMRIVSEKEEVK
jgi:hypothetical protein